MHSTDYEDSYYTATKYEKQYFKELEKICPVCGKSFIIAIDGNWGYRFNGEDFCSFTCYNNLQYAFLALANIKSIKGKQSSVYKRLLSTILMLHYQGLKAPEICAKISIINEKTIEKIMKQLGLIYE